MATDKTFSETGIVRVKCDVHPWMLTWIVVRDNSFFAVTKGDGAFELPAGLADGEYELKAWHAQFDQPLSQKIKVTADNAAVNFEFDAAQAGK